MRCLVILPYRGEPGDCTSDLETIATLIRRSDPSIGVALQWADEADLRPGGPMPTMIVSLRHSHRPLPVPGRPFACSPLLKTEQEKAYPKHWVPTPRTATSAWGIALDPGAWGPLVVLKTPPPPT